VIYLRYGVKSIRRPYDADGLLEYDVLGVDVCFASSSA
jgi:hypothetical protein